MFWLFEKKKKNNDYIEINNLFKVKKTKKNLVFYTMNDVFLNRYFSNEVTIDLLKKTLNELKEEKSKLFNKITFSKLQKIIDEIRILLKKKADKIGIQLDENFDFSLDFENDIDYNEKPEVLLLNKYKELANNSILLIDKRHNSFLEEPVKKLPWRLLDEKKYNIFWNEKYTWTEHERQAMKEVSKLSDFSLYFYNNENDYFIIKIENFSISFTDINRIGYEESKDSDWKRPILLFSNKELIHNKEENSLFVTRKWNYFITEIKYKDKKLDKKFEEEIKNIFKDKFDKSLRSLSDRKWKELKIQLKLLQRKEDDKKLKELEELMKIKPLDKDLQKTFEKAKQLESYYNQINDIVKNIEKIKNS